MSRTGRALTQTVGIAFLFLGVISAQSKTEISISPSSVTLRPAQSLQLSAIDSAGGGVHAHWSSADPGIASVDNSGLVFGVAVGQTVIEAHSGLFRATVNVSVEPEQAPPPQEPTPVDSSWVQVYPGDTIQSLVEQYPAATTFYLKAGTHRRQTIRPKDGNRFIGEPGAVLDGEGVTAYAFETLNHHPQRVTLQRLVIQGYVPPLQRGAIQGDNAHAWIIEDNEIHDNAYAGLRTGPGMIVRRNRIYRNGLTGIVGYRSDGVLIEDNEVFANNPSGYPGNTDGGMKFVGCHNLTVRGNHVYGNAGKGIWSDTNYPTVIIDI